MHFLSVVTGLLSRVWGRFLIILSRPLLEPRLLLGGGSLGSYIPQLSVTAS